MFVVLVTIVIKATILLLIILKKDTFCTIIYTICTSLSFRRTRMCLNMIHFQNILTHLRCHFVLRYIKQMETVSLNCSFPSAWHIATRFYRIISKQCTTHKYVMYWDFGYERKTMVLLLNVNGEGRNGFLIETIFSVRYLAMIRYMWRFVCSCFDCLLFSPST